MASAKALELAQDKPASVEEACDFLKVSESKLYELMNSGKLIYGRPSRERVIPWPVLREFLANNLDLINNLSDK